MGNPQSTLKKPTPKPKYMDELSTYTHDETLDLSGMNLYIIDPLKTKKFGPELKVVLSSIKPFLANTPTIHKIDFSNCNISAGTANLHTILTEIQDSAVNQLDFSNNSFYGSEHAFAKIFRTNPDFISNLTYLNLSNCNLSTFRVQVLFSKLKQYAPIKLEYLNLSNNKLNDSILGDIKENYFKGKLKELKTLDVTDNNIFTIDQKYLSNIIPFLELLKTNVLPEETMPIAIAGHFHCETNLDCNSGNSNYSPLGELLKEGFF